MRLYSFCSGTSGAEGSQIKENEMGNATASASSKGIGFSGLLTILFIALKLLKVIDWKWIWVLSPLWIGFSLTLLLIIIVIAIGIAAER